MLYPFDFTEKQYNSYIACIRNLRVGDFVELFEFTKNGLAEVILINNEIKVNQSNDIYLPTIILGRDSTNFYNFGSWPPRHVAMIKAANSKYTKFHHIDSRLHIKKIIKKQCLSTT